MKAIDEILKFWFGTPDKTTGVDSKLRARWFKKDLNFDREIEQKFGHHFQMLESGSWEAWTKSPRGTLALVLICDQFSRNVFRDTPKAFAFDSISTKVVTEAIEQGRDQKLSIFERPFLYVPLMHAESLELQNLCIEKFQELAKLSPEPQVKTALGFADFAEKHRVIIERFGRFPHRNKILGRESTTEEIGFLKQPGSAF